MNLKAVEICWIIRPFSNGGVVCVVTSKMSS